MPDHTALSNESEQANITVLRGQNLASLRQEFAEEQISAGVSPTGLGQAFASHLEISPSRLSQFLKAIRPISDKMARQIEAHCKKPTGWLDIEHDADVPNHALETFLALASKAWLASNAAQRKALKLSVKDALRASAASTEQNVR